MTEQITLDLTLLKSEINEIICFIESEKKRLEKNVTQFEASVSTSKHKEDVLGKWSTSLEERASGLESLEHLLNDPLVLLNGSIIAKICESNQLDVLQSETDTKEVILNLENGRITNFFIL